MPFRHWFGLPFFVGGCGGGCGKSDVGMSKEMEREKGKHQKSGEERTSGVFGTCGGDACAVEKQARRGRC